VAEVEAEAVVDDIHHLDDDEVAEALLLQHLDDEVEINLLMIPNVII